MFRFKKDSLSLSGQAFASNSWIRRVNSTGARVAKSSMQQKLKGPPGAGPYLLGAGYPQTRRDVYAYGGRAGQQDSAASIRASLRRLRNVARRSRLAPIGPRHCEACAPRPHRILMNFGSSRKRDRGFSFHFIADAGSKVK